MSAKLEAARTTHSLSILLRLRKGNVSEIDSKLPKEDCWGPSLPVPSLHSPLQLVFGQSVNSVLVLLEDAKRK